MHYLKHLPLLIIMIALTFTFAQNAYTEHHNDSTHDHSHHHHDMMPHEAPDKAEEVKAEAVTGQGVIHTIDHANHKINITHAPIPAINWPEMTMDILVAKDVSLDALKQEQNITFHIALGADRMYRITKIIPAEEGMTH